MQDRSSISDLQNDQFFSRKPLLGQVPRGVGYRRFLPSILDMESVLPERFSLSRTTSLLIGFIEFTFKVGFHRSNRRKEALANTLMEMGPTGQSDSRFPFTVFNVLTLGMIDCKRRIETFLRRSYVFLKVLIVFYRLA